MLFIELRINKSFEHVAIGEALLQYEEQGD